MIGRCKNNLFWDVESDKCTGKMQVVQNSMVKNGLFESTCLPLSIKVPHEL